MKEGMPELASIYRQNPDIAVEDFGERSLVLHCTRIQLVELNATARDVLKKLDGQTSLEEIARAMVEQYDVAFETALADVRAIVAEMRALDLVEPVVQEEGGAV